MCFINKVNSLTNNYLSLRRCQVQLREEKETAVSLLMRLAAAGARREEEEEEEERGRGSSSMSRKCFPALLRNKTDALKLVLTPRLLKGDSSPCTCYLEF